MAITGRYIEANGPRVYCKAYGEDEVLGRPGVSKEPGRFNSTVYGLGDRARPPPQRGRPLVLRAGP